MSDRIGLRHFPRLAVTPPPLKCLFGSGFETGDLSPWAATYGTLAVQSTVKHHGTYGLLATKPVNTSADSFCEALVNWGIQTPLHMCAQVRLKTVTTSDPGYTRLLALGGYPAEECGVEIRINSSVYGDTDPRLLAYYYDYDELSHHTLIQKVSLNTWYFIQIGFLIAEPDVANGWFKMWLDQDLKVHLPNIKTSEYYSGSKYHEVGIMHFQYAPLEEYYFDCVCISKKYIKEDPGPLYP